MNRGMMRKFSLVLLAGMLLSLCAPVLSYAASFMKIHYNAMTGDISGVIYSDQSSIRLDLTDGQGTEDLANVLSNVYTIREGGLNYSDTYFFNVKGNIGKYRVPSQLQVSDDTVAEVPANVADAVYTFDNNARPAAPDAFNDGYGYNAGDNSVTLYMNWSVGLEKDIAGYNVYRDGAYVGYSKWNGATINDVPYAMDTEIAVETVDTSGQVSENRTSTVIRTPGQMKPVQISLDGKPKNYTLKKNDPIVSFTLQDSSYITIPDQYNGGYISLSLIPAYAYKKYSYDHAPFVVNSSNIEASDFVLTASDGTPITISDAEVFDGGNGFYQLGILTQDALDAQGTYSLSMSSTSSDNEISLPNIDTATGSFNVSFSGYSNLTEPILYSYSTEDLVIGDPYPPAKPTGLTADAANGQIDLNWNANTEPDLAGYFVYLDGKRLTSAPITETSYTISGLTNGTTYHVNVSAVDVTGNESLQAFVYPTPKQVDTPCVYCGGPVVVAPPSANTPDDNEGVKTIDESSLTNEQGKVSVKLESGDKQVLIPAGAEALSGGSDLRISNDDLSVDIPAKVLEQLKALVSIDELKDAQISFTLNKVDPKDLSPALEKAENGQPNTNIASAGEAYDFTLSIKTKDGKEQKLSNFDAPIMLKLNMASAADPALAGIYYIDDSGNLEYIGGKAANGVIESPIHHFSEYAVLSYDQSFDDLPASHWATAAVKKMSAQHVINGVSDTQYAPNKQVSRAEFAAFLVRMLDLKSDESARFSDVPVDKWYAKEVAAAAQAGIVEGRPDGTFDPDANVTRQEMTAMLMKAYAAAGGQAAAESDAANFADSDAISEWAKPFVNAAFSLGLVDGQGNDLFNPQGYATRAEAAQVIARFPF